MAAVSENDSSLANKCLALCQALNSQGKAFKFSLTIGNTFSFSLDSGGRTMPNREKKRASPSTMERNARRRKQFLAKKTTSASEENQADLEANQQALVEKRAFKCDQCETLFKTNNGLKIHIGKSHKAPNSPEKLRETSSEVLLSVSPSRKDRRAEPCPNCGGDMSPTHLCQDDPAVEHVDDDNKAEDEQEEIICKCTSTNSACCSCDHAPGCMCRVGVSTCWCTCDMLLWEKPKPKPFLMIIK